MNPKVNIENIRALDWRLQGAITDNNRDNQEDIEVITSILDELRIFICETKNLDDFEYGVTLFRKWKTWLIYRYNFLY